MPSNRDEDSFLRWLPKNAAVLHTQTESIGFIRGSTWVDGTLWYWVEWLTGDLAPNAKAAWVREVPCEMEVLAYAAL